MDGFFDSNYDWPEYDLYEGDPDIDPWTGRYRSPEYRDPSEGTEIIGEQND